MAKDRYKKTSGQWLYLLVILLALFCFSGGSVKNSALDSAQQTTLIIDRQENASRSITYARVMCHMLVKGNAFPFLQTVINLPHLHNRQVTLYTVTMPACLVQTAFFFRAKTCPNNTDGKPSSFLG
ncbi:hypothetical protein [Mucilaginibacter agri]|uniref:Uncharacterized protein n=1 Tax=Mucilaginibacter agri TaxID=2695265 RepID=A0A966DUW4_9SPHI|nr:hypothetical protein [Mucilaginibacter agri]NCD70852.1 hypothetical protein [Mucilaginibacter agri]